MDLLILWIFQSWTFFQYLLRTILNTQNVTLDCRDFVISAFFTRNKATVQPGFEIRKLRKALYLSLITIKPSICLRIRGKLKNVKLHGIHQSIRDIQNIILLWYLVDEGNFLLTVNANITRFSSNMLAAWDSLETTRFRVTDFENSMHFGEADFPRLLSERSADRRNFKYNF